MAKSTMRKITLGLIPLAVIMGMLAFGGFVLGQHNPSPPIVEAQDDPLFTGKGWLVKPFNALKLNNFNPVGVTGQCVLYSRLDGNGTVTVVQFGDGITHTYTSPTQIRVCGDVVHLPPSEIPARLEIDDDD